MPLRRTNAKQSGYAALLRSSERGMRSTGGAPVLRIPRAVLRIPEAGAGVVKTPAPVAVIFR